MAREYRARAKPHRARWPPLRLIPFSPISVASPAGMAAMSSSRQHACRTWRYHSMSAAAELGRSLKHVMLSRREQLRIHGICRRRHTQEQGRRYGDKVRAAKQHTEAELSTTVLYL